MVKLLERCDVLRRPERFELILGACEADFRGRLGFEDREFSQAATWRQALAAMRGVDAGAIAKACDDAAQIPQRIHEARVDAVKALGLQESHQD
jgi:tRNA nucleotidyltransferase (CCA-adding enzyme)